ncbi:hypothetical protein [Streptomyces luteolus]|uniref:Uncharacterized protein n=1 Tax=Streptomyces luteolus TaxID=3043615 RepID=A0ABT6T7Q5_9ACTN|nr:hypothetical protein [Streptomyces sp. B-S-A12]MDI3423933.1 hypothetical protein [Streptomyces sp. B-S-A12]
MRFRTCQRAAVLLLILTALQSGTTALADGKGPGGQGAPRGQAARVDPLAPFSQGASALAGMAAPFVNAASDVMFPRR